MFRPVAIAVALLGLALFLAVAVISWAIYFGGPSVTVEHGVGAVTVDLHFLGEYCIGVTSVDLRSAGGQLKWAVRESAPGLYSRLCSFELIAGANPTIPGDHGDLEVRHPEGSSTFQLASGEVYLLEVCGNNGAGFNRCATREVRIQ